LGPDFYDIRVFDNRKANSHSGTSGFHYFTNDTRLDGKTLFTGSQKSSVKEIEVSEIMDQIAVLPNPIWALFPNCF
jgi:hypothetical protein